MIKSSLNNRPFTGNTLKIIAAVTMLIDHMGLMLLPGILILRVIGRIAFPIYAFMIAEGCAHTGNKLRYFLSVFLLGAICQAVYFFYDRDAYLGILITFSLSILVIYAMQYWKNAVFSEKPGTIQCFAASVIFFGCVAGVYVLTRYVRIDYGFWGCMAPVFASLLRRPDGEKSGVWNRLDNHPARVLMLGICLAILSFGSGIIQAHSLLALPLLLLYSGRRGKAKLKYFFYIFYPLHLAALEGISLLLYYWNS